jgi:catechol 2,3-dioxygenase-like lactoylglutathione lyase family enzyme
MIDHVSVAVRDMAAAMRFYDALLAVLGYRRLDTRGGTAGYGKSYSEFWINVRAEPGHSDGMHVCLRAKSIDMVDAFHATALKAGGADDGAPGVRSHDGNNKYYAAFVRDPDGNRIEAVTFIADYKL